MAEVLQHLVAVGDLPVHRLLNMKGAVVEFPHPSPANGESIKLALRGTLPKPEDYKTERLTYQRKKRWLKTRRSRHLMSSVISSRVPFTGPDRRTRAWPSNPWPDGRRLTFWKDGQLVA